MRVNRRKILMAGFLTAAAVVSGALFAFAPAPGPAASVVSLTEPQSGQKMRHLLCVGDSIAAGMMDNKGGWVKRLGHSLGFQVNNQAQPGAESLDALQTLEASDVSKNEYILIAVGVNDLTRYGSTDASMVVSSAKQREHFKAMLEKAKSMTPHVIVIGTLPVNEDRVPYAPAFYLRNEDVRAQNEMKQELSAEYGAVFINPYDAFTAAGGLKFLEDGIHPDAAGHEWLAAFFGRKLVRV